MPNDTSHEYTELARRLRRALRMGELTPEQAQAEYDAAEPADLPEAMIDMFVDGVFEEHDGIQEPIFEVTEWTPDTSDVESDVYQLNRNEGDADPEINELIDKHRHEALDDDDGGEDTRDHLEDETSD